MLVRLVALPRRSHRKEEGEERCQWPSFELLGRARLDACSHAPDGDANSVWIGEEGRHRFRGALSTLHTRLARFP